jgi:hypothetical protein
MSWISPGDLCKPDAIRKWSLQSWHRRFGPANWILERNSVAAMTCFHSRDGLQALLIKRGEYVVITSPKDRPSIEKGRGLESFDTSRRSGSRIYPKLLRASLVTLMQPRLKTQFKTCRRNCTGCFDVGDAQEPCARFVGRDLLKRPSSVRSFWQIFLG